MPVDGQPYDPQFVDWLANEHKRSHKRLVSLENKRPAGPWIPTTLLNGCVAPPAPMIKVQYRINKEENKVQFRGHVDVNAATSPVHAFTLLRPFWLDYDDSWLTDVWDGSAFAVARAFFDSTNGHVTLTWPAS